MNIGIGIGLNNVEDSELSEETIAKFAGWWDFEDEALETDDYYVSKIGDQDRIALGGVNHPGRAIQYDGLKNQYSRSIGFIPPEFSLESHSGSVFMRVKCDSAPSVASYIIVSMHYSMNILPSGLLAFVINKNGGNVSGYSLDSICDGKWHDIFLVVNKSGYSLLYVDNILHSSKDTTGAEFTNTTSQYFYLGNYVQAYVSSKQIRDVRVFNVAIIDELSRDSIHNNEYVDNCIAWWPMQEGKEGAVYYVKDVIGVNHLINFNFDGTSLVSGPWFSLLNKYGYGNAYESSDLIAGQGSMDNAADWNTVDTRWLVASGYARFLATGDYGFRNNSVISYTTADVLKVTFDVAENTATLKIINQAQTDIKTESTYEIGSHTVIFRPLTSGTGIGFRGIGTDAFRIDNLVVTKYEAAPISPKMTSAAPDKDTLDRDLIFVGQAKYPLMKVDANTLAMPDQIGELFEACEEITVNDWYDVNGDGNDIAKVDIEAYETGKQYYNGELIIVKKDEFYNR